MVDIVYQIGNQGSMESVLAECATAVSNGLYDAHSGGARAVVANQREFIQGPRDFLKSLGDLSRYLTNEQKPRFEINEPTYRR